MPDFDLGPSSPRPQHTKGWWTIDAYTALRADQPLRWPRVRVSWTDWIRNALYVRAIVHLHIDDGFREQATSILHSVPGVDVWVLPFAEDPWAGGFRIDTGIPRIHRNNPAQQLAALGLRIGGPLEHAGVPYHVKTIMLGNVEYRWAS